jgi:hypothetical protein
MIEYEVAALLKLQRLVEQIRWLGHQKMVKL